MNQEPGSRFPFKLCPCLFDLNSVLALKDDLNSSFTLALRRLKSQGSRMGRRWEGGREEKEKEEE